MTLRLHLEGFLTESSIHSNQLGPHMPAILALPLFVHRRKIVCLIRSLHHFSITGENNSYFRQHTLWLAWRQRPGTLACRSKREPVATPTQCSLAMCKFLWFDAP